MATTYLDRARELRSLIDTAAEKADGGPIASETVQALDDAGLYGLLVPREVGGAEESLTDCLDVFAEVAAADGSTGWCLMASNTSAAFFGAWCDDDLASTVFGNGMPRVAGQFAPKGTLTPLDGGGWRLSGQYQFGSGMNDAHFAGAGAITVVGEGESPDYRFAIMPKEVVQIDGNWDVFGLQSTASWDYHATDVDVPANATFSFFAPHRYRGGAVYDMGVLPLTALGHAGWALGVVRRALDEVAQIAATKQRMTGSAPLRDSEYFLMELGQLEARYSAGRAWVYESFRAAQAKAEAGDGTFDEAAAREVRMSTAFVNQEGGDIVRRAYVLAGTASLRSGAMERCFRDIHAGTQHAVVSPDVTIAYGRAAVSG
jgi:indole-3-acetate monooxygenase